MRKTINFTDESIEIIKQYMQENNMNFNKAVNELIMKNKKLLTLEKIKISILKLHEEHQEILRYYKSKKPLQE